MSTEEPVRRDNFEKQSRLYGMLCHLTALAFFLLPGIGQILGPLVIWLIKKDDYPFVYDQGKESLNFEISVTIYTLVAAITCVGMLLVPFIIIFWLVEVIMASIRASDGEAFRYPLTIKFIK